MPCHSPVFQGSPSQGMDTLVGVGARLLGGGSWCSPCGTTSHGPRGTMRGGGGSRDALERKGPQTRSQKRLDRRLEEVAKAVGGRLLSVTNAVEAGTWRQGDSGWA